MKMVVVYGAPCSGKSNYVQNNITDKDVSFDYDLITRAITHSDKHSVDRSMTHPIVQTIERSMLIKLKEDYENKPERIFYATRYANKYIKEKLKDFEVEYVKMEATKEECLDRLEKDDSRPDKEVWAKKIDDWFNNEEEQRIKKINKLKRSINKNTNTQK